MSRRNIRLSRTFPPAESVNPAFSHKPLPGLFPVNPWPVWERIIRNAREGDWAAGKPVQALYRLVKTFFGLAGKNMVCPLVIPDRRRILCLVSGESVDRGSDGPAPPPAASKESIMSVTSFTLPATVAFKAQGVESAVDVTTLHADAIAAIFTYGMRRWMQDHVNSAANLHGKTIEDAKEKGLPVPAAFDPESCIAARIAQAVEGKLSIRAESSGPTFTAQEEAVYAVAVEVKGVKGWESLAAAWKAAKGMGTDDRKTTILKAVAALPDAPRGKLVAVADARVKSAADLAAMAL